jgi:hypothetical protein
VGGAQVLFTDNNTILGLCWVALGGGNYFTILKIMDIDYQNIEIMFIISFILCSEALQLTA